MKQLKFVGYVIQQRYYKLMAWITLLMMNTVYAGSNSPWGGDSSDISDGNVAGAITKRGELVLKYVLTTLGGVMIITGIIILINRLMEDTREKQHANLLTTIILVAGCIGIGVALIAYAWGALSKDVT